MVPVGIWTVLFCFKIVFSFMQSDYAKENYDKILLHILKGDILFVEEK
jgi:hypothetical protein